jgi:hypothetical protein
VAAAAGAGAVAAVAAAVAAELPPRLLSAILLCLLLGERAAGSGAGLNPAADSEGSWAAAGLLAALSLTVLPAAAAAGLP